MRRATLLLAAALALAGCAMPVGNVRQPGAEKVDEPPEPEFRAFPQAYAGTTPTGVCANNGTCTYTHPGENATFITSRPARAAQLTAEVAYGPQAQGSEFRAAICRVAQDDVSQVSCDGWSTGPSPLIVVADLSALEENAPLAVVARSAGAGGATLTPASFSVVLRFAPATG